MSDKLKIFIDGSVYSNWTRVEVIKNIEAVTGAFNVTLARPDIFKFVPGKELRIEIEGVPVITGYVEGVEFSGETEQYQLTVQGRDKTGDIVDCSAVTSSSEFLNLSYKTLAEQLCSPFGIKVKSNTSKANTKIAKVSMQQGSVFEELEREARKIGIFIFPDAEGNLLIDEIGSETLTTRLTNPGNIVSYSAGLDISSRFSQYIMKGQQGTSGVLTAKQQSQVSAKATDENVSRYRPLIIVAGSNMNSAQAKSQVEWEAAVRAGRSEEIKITVEGWTDLNARLWEVNKLISVSIAPLNFESQMLIKTVSFRYNEAKGQVTELTLADPQAYVPKPVIPKKSGKTSILPKAVK